MASSEEIWMNDDGSDGVVLLIDHREFGGKRKKLKTVGLEWYFAKA